MFFSSHGIRIAAHQPFESVEQAVRWNKDIQSTTVISENLPNRVYVSETDVGKQLKMKIADLKRLLAAYQYGLINEKKSKMY